ncbi:MAG: hypothetical protein OZ934_07995 [Anaerolineae bacterium]|nr:hypothetical protein [Anaerolineae bacterium]
MSEGERGRRLKFLSVDFVTAMSLEECQEHLRRSATESGQRVSLLEDGSFALRRTVDDEGSQTIAFWGTLETVARGTWVWGTVVETGARRAGRWVYGMALVTLLLALAALESAVRGAWGTALLLLLIVVGIGLLAARLWWHRHRHAMQVVNWVYDLLYVPASRA